MRIKNGLTISFLTLAVVLGGCKTLDLSPEATLVEADIPTPPNAQWVEVAPEDLPTTDWIATFNDPGLSSLLDEALLANTDVRIAEERFIAALTRTDIAAADLLPSVAGSAGLGRTENGNSSVADRTNYSIGVNASWEADLWGRIRDGVNAAELNAAASQADFAGARLAVAGRVSQNWFDLIEARLLTELSERDVETQERALRLTTRRFEGGVTGSSDVRLARSSLANAEALLATRLQRQSALARSLEILLRRYPAEAIQAANDLPMLPALSGVKSPADVLTRRPDILAAEHRMDAAGLNVDIARKALLPSISLSGGLSAGSTNLGDLFDIDALVASITSSLTQPIFQGGRLKANVEQQEAILRQQLEAYAGTVLTAYLEVENALDAETRLYERETALRTSLEEALGAEQRLESRYSEGLATILQLLDAQSRRISAESQLISARKERLANRVRLHVALGGGDLGNMPPATRLMAEN